MKRKASKSRTVEQIIRILRQADGGQTVAEICRVHNIAEGTFYRWKKQYGGMDVADAKRLKALEKENAELKKMLAEAMLDNPSDQRKKMVSPSHKKRAVQYVAEQGMCSTRRACRVVGLATSSYYHRPQGLTDRRHRLEQRIITLSKQHPRWGYRLIHQLLCRWTVNRKRVQRVRRQAGLGVPPVESRKRRPRSARRAPVQAAYPGHVWSWDFIDRTTDGRPVKMLTVVDEYTRQCLVIHPARSITSDQVLERCKRWSKLRLCARIMAGIYRPAHSGLVRYRRHPDALYRAG